MCGSVLFVMSRHAHNVDGLPLCNHFSSHANLNYCARVSLSTRLGCVHKGLADETTECICVRYKAYTIRWLIQFVYFIWIRCFTGEGFDWHSRGFCTQVLDSMIMSQYYYWYSIIVRDFSWQTAETKNTVIMCCQLWMETEAAAQTERRSSETENTYLFTVLHSPVLSTTRTYMRPRVHRARIVNIDACAS